MGIEGIRTLQVGFARIRSQIVVLLISDQVLVGRVTGQVIHPLMKITTPKIKKSYKFV
jgi:hypothetical protein